ncbi:MAG: hypothetical protein LBF97_03275 [Elusimicrobiota bacterium]|jgi:hypothetical protein|nr:hypothetical protein [Elusimicrobiota bacterium]
MLDLTGELKNNDLELKNATVYRVKNLFDIQQGDLIYLQDWGVDLNYWILDDLKFQDMTFIAYLQSRCIDYAIQIENIETVIQEFISRIKMSINN